MNPRGERRPAMSAIRRTLEALANPYSFPREVLRNGFLDRRTRATDWFEYRAAVSRIHAARRATEGALRSARAEDLFAGLERAEATVSLTAATPYNISLQELLVICAITKLQRPDSVFEFGTFDGRTTLHLAMNAPTNAKVYTLDIQAGCFEFGGDARYLAPIRVGQCFLDSPYQSRIEAITGDSRGIDLASHSGAIDLVFVDADHSYRAVLSDSRIAFEMVRPGGVVLWHDYLMIEDVTRALIEIGKTRPLVHIAGTTLAVMKA